MAVTNLSFAEAVASWTNATEEKLEMVFKDVFQNLEEVVRSNTPIKTGFLRNSITVTIGDPVLVDPTASPQNKNYRAGVQSVAIASAKLGDKLSLGFVAAYARRIEYGFEGQDSLGRTYNQSGRGMVRLAVERFPELVAASIAKAKAGG